MTVRIPSLTLRAGWLILLAAVPAAAQQPPGYVKQVKPFLAK